VAESKAFRNARFRRWVIHVMVDNDCEPMTINQLIAAMSVKWSQTPSTNQLGMVLKQMKCVERIPNKASPTKGGRWKIR